MPAFVADIGTTVEIVLDRKCKNGGKSVAVDGRSDEFGHVDDDETMMEEGFRFARLLYFLKTTIHLICREFVIC